MAGGADGRRDAGTLESEVLTVLGGAEAPMTVGEVQQALGWDLAHTTVHTVLTRLCEKGAVARQRAGRGHAYTAVLGEPDLAARRLLRLLDGERDRGAVLSRFLADLRPEDEDLLSAALRRFRGSGKSDG